MESDYPVKLEKDISYYEKIILLFFTYSFIGWVLENIYSIYELGYITERGFLFGPICPIYGYGALILLFFLQPVKQRPLKLFMISIIVFSIFEYVVGYSLEAIFQMYFWDYTGQFLNLNGRVSLSFSLIWGLFSIIFINYLHPSIERIQNRIMDNFNTTILTILTGFLLILYVIDTILSFIRYI